MAFARRRAAAQGNCHPFVDLEESQQPSPEASEPRRTGGTPAQRISKELYYRANDERRARNLSALAWDSQLSSLASSWSSTMASTGSFSHRNLGSLFGSPSYKDRYRTLEENIYEGNGSFGTSGAAHVGFMTSPSHRAALLNPGLTGAVWRRRGGGGGRFAPGASAGSGCLSLHRAYAVPQCRGGLRRRPLPVSIRSLVR